MQLALGAIGAGVGSFFGMASIGWSIGSFLGGQLGKEGQDIKGPRLSDKSITTSAYGNARPILYGGYRVGGDVIWATSLKEHAHKEEAGKGGGGGSYTSYTYTVSFAVALCRGPIVGIRKLWFDGKLVYSVANDASAGELQQSDKLAARIRVYTGTTDQDPDPTIESSLGTGNVPGYRGTAYIVFTDLDVTKYGRLPNVTAEVVEDGTITISGSTISAGGVSAWQSLGLVNGVASVYNWEFANDGSQLSLGIYEQRLYSLIDSSLKDTTRTFIVSGGDESYGFRYLYPVNMSPDGKFFIAETGDIGSGNNSVYRLFANVDGIIVYVGPLIMRTDLDAYKNGDDRSYNLLWEDNNNLWFYKANSGDIYHYEIIVTLLGSYVIKDEHFNVDSTREDLDPNGGTHTFCFDRQARELYVEIITNEGSPQRSIKRYSADGDLLETKFTGITWRSIPGRLMSFSGGVLYETLGTDLRIYEWDTEDLLGTTQISSSSTYIQGAIMESSGALLSVLASGDLHHFTRTLSYGSKILSEIVEDICVSAGMDEADIDTSELTDTVRGFLIGTQTPARGALEQLSAAYFFDGRESDGVLEFIKRGSEPTITLDQDDIGCYEGEPIELLQAERMQEEELPRALTVTYANADSDYQIGAQHASRQSVLEGTEATISLSLALEDDEAKNIVEKMMFVAWQNRHSFNVSTWQSFARIDAADVIDVDGKTMRVGTRDEGVNGLIELRCVSELPAIYTGQIGAGAVSGHASQTISVPGPTQFMMLDIPPMRDVDYARYGMYWVAAGYLDDWSGASLLKSADRSTWDYQAQTDNASVIGNTTTALGDFAGGNIFDETNVLRVYVNGTLESKTGPEVLSGANVAKVGDELVQFKNATLVSTGVYDLSGLLRGRMGTEWAMADHSEYEIFALVKDTAARFVEVPSVDLNTLRYWGVVTYGYTIEDLDEGRFTYTGENLKPLTVVHPSATLEADNDVVLSWDVRTRYRWQWASGIAPSSDETSTIFDIDIYTTSGFTTIIRSVTGVANPWTYTSAMQVSDFGNNQKVIHYRVRQVGAYRNSEWVYTSATASGNRSVLLMHFNGTNGSTVFTDVYGHAVTAFNNAQISTAQSMFGGASALFDGVNDYLSLADSNDWSFGTGNFTIEFFARPTSVLVDQDVIAQRNDTLDANNRWFIRFTSASKVRVQGFTSGGVVTDRTGTISLVANTWVHIAIVRNAGSVEIYVGGVANASGGTNGAGAWPNSASAVFIGVGDSVQSNDYGGYMDELRITKGEAVYTANFTPPAAPFTE